SAQYRESETSDDDQQRNEELACLGRNRLAAVWAVHRSQRHRTKAFFADSGHTADLEVRRRWTIGDGSRAARKAAEASPSRPVADAGGICAPKGSLRLRAALSFGIDSTASPYEVHGSHLQRR